MPPYGVTEPQLMNWRNHTLFALDISYIYVSGALLIDTDCNLRISTSTNAITQLGGNKLPDNLIISVCYLALVITYTLLHKCFLIIISNDTVSLYSNTTDMLIIMKSVGLTWIQHVNCESTHCLPLTHFNSGQYRLVYWTSRTSFSEIWINIQNISFNKMHSQIASSEQTQDIF